MKSHDDWDDYFAPTTRQMRKERRLASQSDRSKYKKTDQEKLLEKDRQKAKDFSSPTTVTGRVLLIRSQNILVFYDNQVFVCSLKGSLKQIRSREKNLIAVGDLVDFSPLSTTCGVIERVHPRTSFLCRQDHLDRIKQQLIAANVDQLVIVVSVCEPTFTPPLIDRYLIAARKGNMQPLIVINKWDLCCQYPKEASLAKECLELYRSLGIPTLTVSAQTKENLNDLSLSLQDKISVLSGPSGSGKSRLLNLLTGKPLTIGAIRAMGKGAHTTSCAQLIPLPSGGWTVDTPGIRSLGIFELTLNDLHDEFSELFDQPCGFLRCLHTQNEDSCSIPKAIEEGTVSPYRYASYLTLLKSFNELRRRR